MVSYLAILGFTFFLVKGTENLAIVSWTPARKALYFSLRWGIYEIGDGLLSKIWKKLLFDKKGLKLKTRENLINLQKYPSHEQKVFFQVLSSCRAQKSCQLLKILWNHVDNRDRIAQNVTRWIKKLDKNMGSVGDLKWKGASTADPKYLYNSSYQGWLEQLFLDLT